jgi:hypothetical protein
LKSSYQTVPKIGQTALSPQVFRTIRTLTASVVGPVLKEKEIRCQPLLPLGAGGELPRKTLSVALTMDITGVSALSSLSVFK